MKYKIFILLLLPFSLSAQLTSVDKVIYRANKADTITVGFSPSGFATLSVKADNEVIDDNIQLSGYHVLNLTLDSGSVVVASCSGIVGYTIYKNGVNITPPIQADNSFTEFLNWYNGLTAAQQRRIVVYSVWKNRFSLKELKKSLTN